MQSIKGKRVSSILLFSLCTMVVDDQIKAMDTLRKITDFFKREKVNDSATRNTYKGQLTECQDTIQKLENKNRKIIWKRTELGRQFDQQSEKATRIKLNLKISKENCDKMNQNPELFSRCIPYGCGTVIAEITDQLFFCFDGTEGRGKSKCFKWLDQSIKDSKILQIFSLAAAGKGDKFHKIINKSSAPIYFLSNGLLIGATNVAGETANAIGLRWCWHRFITSRLKKIDNNPIVTLVYKLPKPIKKIFQDFGRLFIIHRLWNFEKTLFCELKIKQIYQKTKEDFVYGRKTGK